MSNFDNASEADLRQVLADARAVTAKVESMLAARSIPDEPEGRNVHTYIRFTKFFRRPFSDGYQYAAVRPANTNTWTVTGKGALICVSWATLIEFIRKDEASPITAIQSIRELTIK